MYIQKDGRVMVKVERTPSGKNPKGGRPRTVHVTLSGQDHVWAMKLQAEAESRQTVFEHIPGKMDEHSYRREYAAERYRELARNLIPSREEEYRSRAKGKIFDRKALEIITKDLGHNRSDVVVLHYLD